MPALPPEPGKVLRLLCSIRFLISDLDGTLLAGSRPEPGLVPFLDLLRRRGVGLRVVTNNSVRTAAEFSEKLIAAGAAVTPGEILTSGMATAKYLRGKLPRAAPVFVVGEAGLRSTLEQAGLTVVGDSSQDVAAVVVGGDRTIDHEKLKHAIRLVRRGARFIGTNPDLLVPVEDGLAPEAGVLLAAIAAGAGTAPTIIGKPERPLLEQAIQQMAASPGATAIIGDRLETDILGGQRLGLTTILVTTGVDGADAVAAKGVLPDLVVSGLDELTALWTSALREGPIQEPSEHE